MSRIERRKRMIKKEEFRFKSFRPTVKNEMPLKELDMKGNPDYMYTQFGLKVPPFFFDASQLNSFFKIINIIVKPLIYIFIGFSLLISK